MSVAVAPELSPLENAVPWRWYHYVGWGLIHAWLFVHMAAVILPPLTVEPSSELMRAGWQWLAPYIQVLNLNHGYQFFAPEPGPSTLLDYELEYADGHVETGRLPRRGQWPRLLYHRYFMLTEQLASVDSLPPTTRERLLRGYANALLSNNDAERVRLTRVTHLLPRIERIQAGATLDDPASYRYRVLGTFAREVPE